LSFNYKYQKPNYFRLNFLIYKYLLSEKEHLLILMLKMKKTSLPNGLNNKKFLRVKKINNKLNMFYINK